MFGTHMLKAEAEDWWDSARQRMEILGDEITWVVFRAAFLEKYFLEDVCGKKEIEFLELKEGNSTVVLYATMFEEFMKFYRHYNNLADEASKCIKFEKGPRPEIKQGIGYHEIILFHILENNCMIYD